MEDQDVRQTPEDPMEEASLRLMQAKIDLQNALVRLQLMNAVDLERLRQADRSRNSQPAT